MHQFLDLHLPLLHYIPRTKENHFFYRNGLSKLIPRLTVKVHSDLEKCEELWEEFSPHKSLFDLWEFRMAWHSGYGFTPFFYTIYERQKPLGMLPLWFSPYRKKYLWFGSDWMEDNSFFVKEEKLIDLLYQIAPNNMLLNCITVPERWKHKKLYSSFIQDDAKNIKDISRVSTMDDLLQTFEKKDRYNLRSDYNRIDDMNPRVVITKRKSLKKLNMMIKMNIKRFSKDPTDESDLVDADRRLTYEYMVRNAKSYQVRFIETYIQQHLAAIDFIITYKDTYYTMKGGNDINRFKGIGNFMVYTEFEDAIEDGYSTVDCLQMDNGWKHRFFDQRQVYSLEK